MVDELCDSLHYHSDSAHKTWRPTVRTFRMRDRSNQYRHGKGCSAYFMTANVQDHRRCAVLSRCVQCIAGLAVHSDSTGDHMLALSRYQRRR